jgi:hypothetical protein
LSSDAEGFSCFAEDNDAKKEKVLYLSPVPKSRQRYNYITGGQAAKL